MRLSWRHLRAISRSRRTRSAYGVRRSASSHSGTSIASSNRVLAWPGMRDDRGKPCRFGAPRARAARSCNAGAMARLVAADASPLIGLATAGALGMLRELYGTVTITRLVKDEVTARNNLPGARELDAAMREGWIRVAPAPLATWGYAGIDAGEASTIALATQHRDAVVLMDDTAGRAQAAALGLEVVDVAGLLLAAQARGAPRRRATARNEARTRGLHAARGVAPHAAARSRRAGRSRSTSPSRARAGCSASSSRSRTHRHSRSAARRSPSRAATADPSPTGRPSRRSGRRP